MWMLMWLMWPLAAAFVPLYHCGTSNRPHCSPPSLFAITRIPRWSTVILTATSAPSSENPPNRTVALRPVRRKRQQRRKPRNRRPRNYWTEPDNLAREIRLFWEQDCGLENYSASIGTTLIPSENLLYYYGRHDLRAALVSTGGRETVAELLGGARILPGRWKEAVQDPQIQALLAIDPTLSADLSPVSAANVNQTESSSADTSSPKWSHASDRRPKGFWNLQRVVQELYLYVDGVRDEHGRPAVWMPRPNEMAASGRDDLRQALQRFGGTKKICALAGMVPFREWYVVSSCPTCVNLYHSMVTRNLTFDKHYSLQVFL